ncbi:MAG: membrane protein of unknown function [Promethearchaeota archaeon]|nr:MAG: membrane protein of unknown function [Candidatus Lokiarchaeota archaeon]
MKKRNFISLALLGIITSFYTLMENSWFNSWLGGVVKSSNFEISIMVSLNAAIGIVSYLVLGAISDNIRTKFGRRKPVLVMGLLLSSFFIIMFSLSKNYLICLLLDGIILGITGNMMWSSWQPLIADLTTPRSRGKVNSNIFIFISLGGFFITIIEILGDTDSRGFFTEGTHLLVFYITAISMLVVAIIISFSLKEPPMEELPPQRKWYNDLKSILDTQELKEHKEFYKFLIATTILICGKFAFYPLLIVFRQIKGFDSFQRLISYVILGIATFIGTFILLRLSDKFGRKKVMIFSIPMAIGGLLLSIAIDLSFIVFLIGYFLIFFFIEGSQKTQETWAQDLADEHARGKFLGIANIAQTIGRIPGLMLGGYIADLIDISAIFFVGAIIMVFSIPLYGRVRDIVTPSTTLEKEKSSI